MLVISTEDGSSVFAVARKIRGRFDVAILFPSFLRPGIEIWLAGIPRRVGFSKPWRDLFINQFVRQRSGSLPRQEMGLSESLNALARIWRKSYPRYSARAHREEPPMIKERGGYPQPIVS